MKIFLFFCLGLLIGYLIGRRILRRKRRRNQTVSKDYFIGLNYLLSEQPDKAVDVFIRMLEVDSDTIEMHFALGSLFRRRGETDRAIRIHQNLLTRANLDKILRVEILMELGCDYMAAGVHDRAERLFQEVVEAGKPHRVAALYYLLDIYEREKDWQAALTVAQQLQEQGENVSHRIAQYYCELVEESRQRLSLSEIKNYLDLAVKAAPNSIRSKSLIAKYIDQTDTSEALTSQEGHYQCEHCGYSGKKLTWQCPSCRRWETIKPKNSEN
ncbi:MAG: tetratricopeptide repeat protein [Gammaproteobacteria bacterium]|nr:tetratricopeptide repeat protein [Gammaproteobacteria bacterium]